MKVAIIIPVIRLEGFKRCYEAIKNNAGYIDYVILSELDRDHIGCPKMVAKLVAEAPGDVDAFCFLGDDTIPQKDFLKNAVEAMGSIPGGKGLVTFNDNPNNPRSRAHWLAHKSLLTEVLDGEFFHTGYKHCFCDDELYLRCAEQGKHVRAENCIIIHDHPLIRGEAKEGDELYHNVYKNDVFEADKDLFNARSITNWGKGPKETIAVLIPAGDMCHTQFALSLASAVAYAAMHNVRIAVLHYASALLAFSRSELVKQALGDKIKASKVIFVDSDMTFPYYTFTELLAHNEPIVCVDAARRMEPITNVVKDKNNNFLDHTKPLPRLVEVDKAGTGIVLININVFKNIDDPYFHVEYANDHFVGEDYYFSMKTRKAGYTIYCDTGLSKKIGHIGCKTYKVEK